MHSELELKLKNLPRTPGVYFHKSSSGEIIYIGKAAVLKNRVRQYFQSGKDFDTKTRALVAEIADVDWVETESEIDALFLESEMVKRYMPRYNILLRDDKSQTFIRIDMKSDWPTVSFTRNPADDKANYYGPYYSGYAVKKALRYLRRVYPYYTKPPKPGTRPDLDAHIGLSPHGITSGEYKADLKKLISYIKGNRKALVRELEQDMKQAAKHQDFERAASWRNKLRYLGELQRRIMFGDREFLDISKDQALVDLKDLLGLSKAPVRIEGYDISHMGGTNVVASMVVFTNGVSDRGEYRKFKTRKEQNDDFYNMNETLLRRLSSKNLKSWGKPDLILIDGGKGQLDAAIKARDMREVSDIPFIGIAKKEEQIVIAHERSKVSLNKDKLTELNGYETRSKDYVLVNLPHSSHIVKLLQRIRDESHRFAVSYHTTLKRAKAISSQIEEIPGVGAKTRLKLMKSFGSLKGIKEAPFDDIAATVGPAKAKLIVDYLHASDSK